jgi:hypothetical protein
MEKPRASQFKRKFADAVGRMPFPGRHTVGPAAIRALRTPDIEDKQRDRRLISRFRLANAIIGLCGTSASVFDGQLLFDESQPLPLLYGVPLVLGSTVAAASFASAYAQTYLIERVDHSIETAKNAPYEVGIDTVPSRADPVYRDQRWPASVEARDHIIHGAVFYGWIASNMAATVANTLVNQ